MQEPDGSMTKINAEQFEKFLAGGHRNVVTVGDVFRVRSCHFKVETISEHGISARGISERDYVAALEGDSSRKVEAGFARMQMANRERNQPCPCGSGKKYKKCCGRS